MSIDPTLSPPRSVSYREVANEAAELVAIMARDSIVIAHRNSRLEIVAALRQLAKRLEQLETAPLRYMRGAPIVGREYSDTDSIVSNDWLNIVGPVIAALRAGYQAEGTGER